MRLFSMMLLMFIFGCHSSDNNKQSNAGSVYVEPTIDKNGKFNPDFSVGIVMKGKKAIKTSV